MRGSAIVSSTSPLLIYCDRRITKTSSKVCSVSWLPPAKYGYKRGRALPLSLLSIESYELRHCLCTLGVNAEHFRCSSLSSPCPNWIQIDVKKNYGDDEFIVVNFYRFVFIKDPKAEVSNHLSFLQGRDIHGRIYLSEQGINAQYSGPSKDAFAYVAWLKEDYRFLDILVQISSAQHGHAFPRLKLRYKPSLVQIEGGISHLPLVDPSLRATPLTASQWRNKLEAVKNNNYATDANTSYVLLDVRNGYEWDVGHFNGAQRPLVDCFRSTSFGQYKAEVSTSDPLSVVDKEKADVLMYCTGGIRCDVYSAILREKGFKNLYTLYGGVSHYLKSEGPVEWIGNLFVFDSRLSLPPSVYRTEIMARQNKEVFMDTSFARCYICGLEISELRHRNCANLDCNLLFLCCISCKNNLRGCCCLKCSRSPRVRPLLSGHERYNKWHIYRDLKLQST